MGILSSVFTWWNGSTIGTRLYTSRNGARVGEDDFGNVYYQNTDGTRRWVIYHAENNASNVPSEWHGWLHHTFKDSPVDVPLKRWAWEKDHKPNMTGTPEAYHPPGSLLSLGENKSAKPAYTPWVPE